MQSEGWGNEEATSVEPDDNVGRRGGWEIGGCGEYVGGDEGAVKVRRGEEGKDVFEEDARLREVGVLFKAGGEGCP